MLIWKGQVASTDKAAALRKKKVVVTGTKMTHMMGINLLNSKGAASIINDLWKEFTGWKG